MPTTRLSLIQRLCNADDQQAWRTFVELYFPTIVHSLQAKGLQPADAEDCAQQVLLSVARALARRPHDPNRARFRTWLERVIRNAALKALQRAPPDQGAGGTDFLQALHSVAQPDEDAALLEQERRKQLMRMAAAAIEGDFTAETWQAFWRTAVLGEPIDHVAKDLNKEVGSVYAARSRIIRRLREEIARIEAVT